MKRPKRRIKTVRVGNAAVKVYRRTRTVDGNRYPTFEVCDYTGGRRRLRSFADHQAAQREARRIAGLLAGATPDFLPCLAIGGFAGLRTSEILALDWCDVRLLERTIKVTHRKERCAGTRLAPITEDLAKWLSPLAKKSGPVWPHGQTWRERARSITAAQNATAEAEGKAWFAIVPLHSAANVVGLPSATRV